MWRGRLELVLSRIDHLQNLANARAVAPVVSKIRQPDDPGLGIELNEDQMEEKLGHDWDRPKTYHSDDGSVVNC